MESLFPDQESNLCPLRWKHKVLTPGQPGKSPLLPLLTPLMYSPQRARVLSLKGKVTSDKPKPPYRFPAHSEEMQVPYGLKALYISFSHLSFWFLLSAYTSFHMLHPYESFCHSWNSPTKQASVSGTLYLLFPQISSCFALSLPS